MKETLVSLHNKKNCSEEIITIAQTVFLREENNRKATRIGNS